MTSEHKTQIIIAIIGLAGVVATTLFTNWDKIFEKSEVSAVKESNRNFVTSSADKIEKNSSRLNESGTVTNRALAYEKLSKGHEFRKNKDYESAIPYYLESIKADRNYAEAYYWLGNTYHHMDRIRDAIQAYNRSIEIEPDDASVYDGLGNAYYKIGDHNAAINNFNKAIKISPYANTYDGLASTYYQMGKFSEAISAWQTVLRMEPDNNNAKEWINRAKDKLSGLN